MSEANSNLPHIAAAMTLARYFAKREVQWQVASPRHQGPPIRSQ
jgi:hypothetical protein